MHPPDVTAAGKQQGGCWALGAVYFLGKINPNGDYRYIV